MLLCGYRPRRLLQLGQIGLLILFLLQSAGAQSIDTHRSQATIGEPVEMSLQVRAFDIPPAQLGPDCIAVRLQHADSGEAILPIRIRTVPNGQDNQVTVQIRSPALVEEPVLIGRVDLLCGATFSREFTVLADPPRRSAASRRPAQARQTATPHPEPPTAAASPLRTVIRPITTSTPPADEAALAGAAELIARLITERLPHLTSGAQIEPAEAWRHLHEQQRETRAALDELKSQLARQDTHAPPWRDAALVAGTLIGLGSCMMIGRLLHDRPAGSAGPGLARRRQDPADAKPQRHAAHIGDAKDPSAAPVDNGNASHATPQDARIITIEWPQAQGDEAPPSTPASALVRAPTAPPATEDRSCWQDSNFGHPRLDDEGSQALLAELDATPPGNADQQLGWIMVLERRLLEGQGRCPWLLIRLLALYEQLHQPWNHERVAAQLEALYNVRVPQMPSMSETSPETETSCTPSTQGRPRTLEQHALTWQQVCEHWNEGQAEAHLAALLLRPTALEKLDLPAFEELLTLHGLLLRREQMPRTSVPDVVEFEMLAA
ncbi:MAG: hypothetical protein RL654_819 [Pseudomonadota bacterium]|jgi:hypothetical protein